MGRWSVDQPGDTETFEVVQQELSPPQESMHSIFLSVISVTQFIW